MFLNKILKGAALVALIVSAFFGAEPTLAADYPSRPIRLIVGYAAGGPSDVAARIYAKYLAQVLGTNVIVDNRPGASGMVAANVTTNAAPDGYTLYYVASPTVTITPLVQHSATLRPLQDLSYVSILYDYANVLIVAKDSKFKSVADLIARAKAAPGSVSYGTAGVGASNHLAAELLAQNSHVQMLHVPYKGNNPASVDIQGGKVDFMFDVIGSAVSQVKGGKFRALAIASSKRSPVLPDVPTVDESGLKGFEVGGWYGVAGPKGLPADVVSTLVKADAQVAANGEYRKWMEQYGYEVKTIGPQEMLARVKKELEMWATVVKQANIKVD